MQFVSKLKILTKSSLNRRNWPYLFFFAAILFIFLINTLHESYPDEFDNILGGWYILHGKLIYTGFFTHHGPIPYYLSALVEIFSGRSFVAFRIVYAVLLFIFTAWSFRFLKDSIKKISLSFYLGFILLFGVAATYFWGHMLLADNVSAVLLTPVFALVFLKIFNREVLTIKDYLFISVLTSLSLLSSLTYLYLIVGVIAFLGILYARDLEFKPRKIVNKQTGKILLIFIAPYLIFGIYLLLTLSLKDYLLDAITFNQKYYIYNYPRPEGSTTINPIRYAIVIAQNFQNNFSSLLINARDFNFTFPFNISLAVANAGLFIFLLLKRRIDLTVFLWLVLTFANARSNPWTSSETDYQSAVYIMISLFNLVFVTTAIYQELKKDLEYPQKLILSFLLIVISIYSLFNVTFLVRKFSYKAYDKFMGTQATIYDRPKIAPLINSIATKDEYAWIGPFEFEELFYMNAKIPSKYMILLPAFGESLEIQQQMISDLEKNPPKIIYFDRRFFILGRSPEMYGSFFLNYLKNNYMTLGDYEEGGSVYKSNLPVDNKIDLETKLYINKNNFSEVKQELLDKNLIHQQ